MEIKSNLSVPQVISTESVIHFPNGIPGFENQTRFQLFQQQDSDVIFLLQSLIDKTIVLSIAQPCHFNINYSFILTDDEENLLQLESIDDLLILLILHKDENDSNNHPVVKGSIKSPLLINTKSKIGIQKILPTIEQSITLTEQRNEIEVSEI